MLIQCTKKLLDQLKIKPNEEPATEDPLFSWHANLLTINRRKAIVLMNDRNRYVIALYGLLAKDFKKLDEIIPEAIRTVFRKEQIKDKVIEQYLQHVPTITYTKTKDNSSVAKLNKSVKTVRLYSDLLDHNIIIQQKLSARASRYIVGTVDKTYIEPAEELVRDLEKFSG